VQPAANRRREIGLHTADSQRCAIPCNTPDRIVAPKDAGSSRVGHPLIFRIAKPKTRGWRRPRRRPGTHLRHPYITGRAIFLATPPRRPTCTPPARSRWAPGSRRPRWPPPGAPRCCASGLPPGTKPSIEPRVALGRVVHGKHPGAPFLVGGAKRHVQVRVDDGPGHGPKIEMLLAIYVLLLLCRPTRRRRKPQSRCRVKPADLCRGVSHPTLVEVAS
jgi:hypothetical protein